MANPGHSAAMREDICDAVLALIDGDAAAGKIVLKTATDAVVATLPLAYPAGTVAAAVLTFDCTPALEDTNATGNASPVTKFEVQDNTGDVVLTGDVTATSGGGDLELSSTTINAGDTVSISSFTYTAPV
jgi:hypothetical protein